MGRCSLDITGPVAFGRHICQLLGVPLLQQGVHTYSIHRNNYIIDVGFVEVGGFISYIHNPSHRFLKTKTNDHAQLLYKTPEHNYALQYKNNQVYRE